MHIFTLIEHIKGKPSIFLDGDKSLKRLRSFIVGYESGGAGGDLTGQEELRDFDAWVAHRLGFDKSTQGWCNMIISRAGSDEKAYDLFFELLEKYKKKS